MFAVSGFFFNFQTAQMQTGASRIVFERYDSRTGATKVYTAKTDGTNENVSGKESPAKEREQKKKLASEQTERRFETTD